MEKNKKLKEEAIIDRWSVLIDDADGKGKEIFKKTEENLKEIEAPKIEIVEKKISLSFVKKLAGETKTFLVVRSTYLQGYLMYIGAMDYGKQLFVSWYLTLEPSKFRQFLASLPWWIQLIILPLSVILIIYDYFVKKAVSPYNMDFSDLEELTAYVTTVHRALINASKEISEEVDFDFTKVDQRSRGFLNIS